MDEENVMYTYTTHTPTFKGILFILEKEGNSAT